jgi:hypothetical protein
MQRWLEKCNAVGEMMRCFAAAARYGDAWGHVLVDDQDNVAVEYVPNREVYPDWRHEQPGDGAFFFRKQDLTEEEAVDWLGQIPWVDAGKLDAAVRQSAGEVVEQEGDDPRGMPSKPRTVQVTEAWLRVPRKALTGTEDEEQPLQRVGVLAFLVGTTLVGTMENPGDCPYRRFVWQEKLNEVYGEGLPDMLWELQDAATGQLRALDDGAKILSGAILGVDDSVAVDFNDVREALTSGKVVRVRPGEDVRRLVTLLQMPVDLASMLSVLQKYIDLGDHFCPVQLTQSGQSQNPSNTAFELQQRLENAGKFLLSVVRNFALFASPLLEEMFVLALELEGEADRTALRDAHVRAKFEASYIQKFEQQKALLMLLSVLERHPDMARRVDMAKVLRMLVEGTSLKMDEIMRPEDDPALDAMAEAEQMRAQAEQALMDAQLAKAQAEQMRAQAHAQELESRIALNAARAQREQAAADVLTASIPREAARTANDIRRTVAIERNSRPTMPRVPDPGRAALLPGGSQIEG